MSQDPEVVLSPFAQGFDFATFANNNRQCRGDGCQNEATMKCGRCNSAQYCSRECQIAHWKSNHKRICQSPTTDSIFIGELPAAWTATSPSAITLSPSSRSSARVIYDDTQRNKEVPHPSIYSMASRPSLIGHLEHHSNSTDGSFRICVANGEGSFISQAPFRFVFQADIRNSTTPSQPLIDQDSINATPASLFTSC